ncbi:MAG: diguanylate cyclase [Actinomycetota bacterium]|nr:diguanylate cyclase [Actinomycetota bacterium]
MVAEKDRPKVESTFLAILKKPGRQSRLLEFTAHGKHGNIALAGHIAPITYNKGRVEGVRGVMVDITLLKKKEEALADSEKRYRRLFDNSRDGIYVSTLEGKYVDANPALASMLGYSSREDLLSKDIKKDIYADGSKRPVPTQRTQPFETQLKKADGSKIWVEISCQVIEQDGKPAYYEGIVRDISVRKEYEQKLRYKSFHDGLTGLYNRAYFEEELKRLDRKRQLPLSIIIGDVNSLKLINDAFGHQQGDQLLEKAAEILKKACRKEDIIARWGGDEFAILLPRTPQEVAAKVVARIKDIAGGYSIADVPVSISLGKCTKSDYSQDIQKVIEEAEDSMYHHKLVEKKRLSGKVIMSMEQALLRKKYVNPGTYTDGKKSCSGHSQSPEPYRRPAGGSVSAGRRLSGGQGFHS